MEAVIHRIQVTIIIAVIIKTDMTIKEIIKIDMAIKEIKETIINHIPREKAEKADHIINLEIKIMNPQDLIRDIREIISLAILLILALTLILQIINRVINRKQDMHMLRAILQEIQMAF